MSISYAAIELANKIFSDLSAKTVMLLGAGEMAELAVEHLISHHVRQIRVSNRTFENALCLAERFNGRALGFEERVDALTEVDIIISSTGASEYVITADQVKKAMKKRKYRTLFLSTSPYPETSIRKSINCPMCTCMTSMISKTLWNPISSSGNRKPSKRSGLFPRP